jgi:phosphotransacetylase
MSPRLGAIVFIIMNAPFAIANYLYSELSIGQSMTDTRVFSTRDMELMSVLSGMPADCQGWNSVVLASIVGERFPGPGSTLLALELNVLKPVIAGTKISTRSSVREKRAPDVVVLEIASHNSDTGELIVSGVATVRAPSIKLCLSCADLPEVSVHEHIRHRQLISRCVGLNPASTAVVHPCDPTSLCAAVEATHHGLIIPVLVGPEAKIRAVAAAEKLDISAFRLVSVPHSHAAAAEAVAMARRGEVEALMKGSLHTDELMHEVVAAQTGLTTDRRISHVYLFDVAAYPRPLMITDAAINITPDLDAKRDICQNAIDLAHVVGIARPKVAILSAIETVNDKMRSTLDAAALCKMADRGQIKGADLDGPLAFDNAISMEAARTKGIASPVAGQADILLVPDLEAGNMLAKQLTFFDGADGAGIVLGARIPMILTSRADPPRTRLASVALALLVVQAKRAS